jgi:hypothetical protein
LLVFVKKRTFVLEKSASYGEEFIKRFVFIFSFIHNTSPCPVL